MTNDNYDTNATKQKNVIASSKQRSVSQYAETDIYALLPKTLEEAISAIDECRQNNGYTKEGYHISDVWCWVNSEINCTENNEEISTELAKYLREKYL